jgi:protein phosphatase 2C
VIAEPEITVTERTAEDECMILATDGMWDVIANDVACNVARHCLEDGNPPPAATAGREEEPRCVRATSLLARLAIGRETLDNVSIIVVDLKHRE